MQAGSQALCAAIEAAYGIELPPVYDGTLSEAFQAARLSYRPVAVYLHSSIHEDAERFCRDVLASPDMRQLISAHCVFWMASVHTEVGLAASTQVSATGFPFLGVYASTTAPTLSRASFRLVWQAEGYAAPQTLIQQCGEAVGAASTTLETMQADVLARQQDRELREEQERCVLLPACAHMLAEVRAAHAHDVTFVIVCVCVRARAPFAELSERRRSVIARAVVSVRPRLRATQRLAHSRLQKLRPPRRQLCWMKPSR